GVVASKTPPRLSSSGILFGSLPPSKSHNITSGNPWYSPLFRVFLIVRSAFTESKSQRRNSPAPPNAVRFQITKHFPSRESSIGRNQLSMSKDLRSLFFLTSQRRISSLVFTGSLGGVRAFLPFGFGKSNGGSGSGGSGGPLLPAVSANLPAREMARYMP